MYAQLAAPAYVSSCEGLRMPAVGPQPHPASAGVGKPAMHEVAEGRVPGCSGFYGDLMPADGPADLGSRGQYHRWSMITAAIPDGISSPARSLDGLPAAS